MSFLLPRNPFTEALLTIALPSPSCGRALRIAPHEDTENGAAERADRQLASHG